MSRVITPVTRFIFGHSRGYNQPHIQLLGALSGPMAKLRDDRICSTVESCSFHYKGRSMQKVHQQGTKAVTKIYGNLLSIGYFL